MTVTRFKITVDIAEYEALEKDAKKEFRSPEEQAHYIIRTYLKGIGLLPENFEDLDSFDRNGIIPPWRQEIST